MRFKKCKCCKKRKPLTTKGGVCLKCEWVLLSEEFSSEIIINPIDATSNHSY